MLNFSFMVDVYISDANSVEDISGNCDDSVGEIVKEHIITEVHFMCVMTTTMILIDDWKTSVSHCRSFAT